MGIIGDTVSAVAGECKKVKDGLISCKKSAKEFLRVYESNRRGAENLAENMRNANTMNYHYPSIEGYLKEIWSECATYSHWLEEAERLHNCGALNDEVCKTVLNEGHKAFSRIARKVMELETGDNSKEVKNADSVVFEMLAKYPSTAEALVRAWRTLNPNGSRKECVEATRLSKSCVNKFWNEKAEEGDADEEEV